MAQTVLVQTPGYALASWTQQLGQSALRDLLAVAVRPDIISFALGMPSADLFPVDAYTQAAAEVLATDRYALQYGLPFHPLKRHIVELMRLRGVSCREEQVFLATGAQHAMSLIARLLLEPGGQVLMEEVVYDGMQAVIKPFLPEVITVPTDRESGMDVDAVESLLIRGARPAFIYTITDGHNPLGLNMSSEKRQRLVELARHYCIPIVEDDAYGLLNYDGDACTPMRALDDEWVFYVGSFSKILAPALRVGWAVVPESLISRLSIAKHASDMDICSFTQRSVSALLDKGIMPDHLALLRRVYRERRDLMLSAMHKEFPIEVHWRQPQSGLFIWVELPHGADAFALLQSAIESERVAFIPGQAFCQPGEIRANNCMRLNFSNCPVTQIEEGIARLARVISQEVQ